MFVSLVRKELLSSLLTLRFAISLIFIVVLAALATYIGSLEYSQRLGTHRSEAAKVQERLNAATTYRQVSPDVVIPPAPEDVS